MSSAPLPVYVDARRAFLQEMTVIGHIDLEALPRTRDCVVKGPAQVHVELRFILDSAGRRRISGSLRAPLTLACQRCLEPNAVEIDEIFDLVMVADEAGARTLDQEFDPWICADHRIVLADLVDEQLLLGMPIVSLHQQGPCRDEPLYEAGGGQEHGDDADTAEATGPFAVLAALKRQ